jgi:hypothetical protein
MPSADKLRDILRQPKRLEQARNLGEIMLQCAESIRISPHSKWYGAVFETVPFVYWNGAV